MNMLSPRFSKDTMVRVYKDNKPFMEGKIVSSDMNLLTFKWEYDVEYWDVDEESKRTMIGVPEENIERS